MKKQIKKPAGGIGAINSTAYDESLFSWRAPEYIHREKGSAWKLIVSVLWIALVLYAFFKDSWTFAVALLIFGGVYALVYHEKPKKISVKISRVGVKLGAIGIPYSHIRAFWLHYDPPHLNQMHLRLAGRFSPDFVISLEDQDPAQLREYLATQVPEWEGKREDFTSTLVRILKL